jgi:hypothetical protein
LKESNLKKFAPPEKKTAPTPHGLGRQKEACEQPASSAERDGFLGAKNRSVSDAPFCEIGR